MGVWVIVEHEPESPVPVCVVAAFSSEAGAERNRDRREAERVADGRGEEELSWEIVALLLDGDEEEGEVQ
jgi:hypothetical protein